jgi:hypothetical protein
MTRPNSVEVRLIRQIPHAVTCRMNVANQHRQGTGQGIASMWRVFQQELLQGPKAGIFIAMQQHRDKEPGPWTGPMQQAGARQDAVQLAG